MSQWKSKKESNPATHLMREALLLDAVYKNIRIKEAVENEEYELSKRLTRQPSRYFRDDMTITVIELEDGVKPDLEQVGPVHDTQEVDPTAQRLANPPPLEKKSWFKGWIWSRT
ncbi:hypothetical protein G6F56_013223 [Rhizopus delemar]|nr:hypothetical protein G6F56_013223 [Rhizopus delemar]